MRKLRAILPAWLLVLIAMALAGACGGASEQGDRETGPLVLYEGEWSGDGALLQGTLVRDGECLYVETEDPASGDDVRTLVAFKASDTSWDAEQEAVVTPDRALPVGERVELGGGMAGDTPRDEWAVPPDESCDTSRTWISGRP